MWCVYTRTQARYTALAVSVACIWHGIRCLCHFALVHVSLLVLSFPLALSLSLPPLSFSPQSVPVLVGISVNTAHKMLSARSYYRIAVWESNTLIHIHTDAYNLFYSLPFVQFNSALVCHWYSTNENTNHIRLIQFNSIFNWAGLGWGGLDYSKFPPLPFFLSSNLV